MDDELTVDNFFDNGDYYAPFLEVFMGLGAQRTKNFVLKDHIHDFV